MGTEDVLASVFPEPKRLVEDWIHHVWSHEAGIGVGVGLKLDNQLARVVEPPSPPLLGTRMEAWATPELWTGWGWGCLLVPGLC